ncbi:hypothetical protein [Sanguibacter sp. Z1732]|uniref:hypothetical protein n=1 Tax=Sanguibacter sp. Z1732 TaxID=3435412 RepID=UPI003D9CBB5D
MSAAEIVLVALAVAALLALLLWSVAQRLDRLHRREFQTRATLEAQLVHRADTAAELASSGLLDPASSVWWPTPRWPRWGRCAWSGRRRPVGRSPQPNGG